MQEFLQLKLYVAMSTRKSVRRFTLLVERHPGSGRRRGGLACPDEGPHLVFAGSLMAVRGEIPSSCS